MHLKSISLYFYSSIVALTLNVITVTVLFTSCNRVRNYRGRVSNFDQSEARKQCFLASDWSKFDPIISYSIKN